MESFTEMFTQIYTKSLKDIEKKKKAQGSVPGRKKDCANKDSEAQCHFELDDNSEAEEMEYKS